MSNECDFLGHEISPQAHALLRSRAIDRLHFRIAELSLGEDAFFYLLLVLDVIEHLEDCFSFLCASGQRPTCKVFHVPLDMSVQAVSRNIRTMEYHEEYAHIHHFTKDRALAVLRDTRYELSDYFNAQRSNEIALHLIQRHFSRPRKLFFAIQQDLADRVLYEYSLIVPTQHRNCLLPPLSSDRLRLLGGYGAKIGPAVVPIVGGALGASYPPQIW